MHGDKSLVRLASPRDRNSIRRDAYLLRLKLGLKDTPYFPIVEFLENVLPEIDTSFHIEVLEDFELLGVQAEYVPSFNVIRIKNSVYEAAVSGYWWARATLAHELGHYYFHDEKSVRYAKLDACKKVPPDFDPERQANVFAAELLAPIHLIDGMSEREIGRRCGVSYEIAKRQLRVLERIKLRKQNKHLLKKKRSSPKA
ncbi:MAG: ImmA/IrrE family metallo-endopeptidase [Oscillospiraceae bacterium]|nr:ImmA/IrrE family metallo-endopeptidase [Oscillospiraceae bacterium]MBS6371361.1 ImmA/IrrE family metallo-endopeptidase [Oscillospiraceae bacterium]